MLDTNPISQEHLSAINSLKESETKLAKTASKDLVASQAGLSNSDQLHDGNQSQPKQSRESKISKSPLSSEVQGKIHKPENFFEAYAS